MKKLVFLFLFAFAFQQAFSQTPASWSGNIGSESKKEKGDDKYIKFLESQGIFVKEKLQSPPKDLIEEINFFTISKSLSPNFNNKNNRKTFGNINENSIDILFFGEKVNFKFQDIYLGVSENKEEQVVFFTNNFILYIKKYKTEIDGEPFSFKTMLIVFSQEENLYLFY